MVKVLVLYDSKTGNTEKMAKAVAEGIKEAGNEVDVKKIGQTFKPSDNLILSRSCLR